MAAKPIWNYIPPALIALDTIASRRELVICGPRARGAVRVFVRSRLRGWRIAEVNFSHSSRPGRERIQRAAIPGQRSPPGSFAWREIWRLGAATTVMSRYARP